MAAMAILFLIVFIDLLGFGAIIPLLPFYGTHFGASPTEVTFMMACYSIAQLIFSPVLGRLSDRVGRRPVLLVSLVVSVVSYVWLGFADALWMLFAARLISGAGAGNIAAAQAYISDITTPETRAKGMGMIGAAFGLGFTLGPALGGLVAGSDPTPEALARPAFLAAGLSLLALVIAFVKLKESRAPTAWPGGHASRLEKARSVLMRPRLRQLILLMFVTISAFAGMETTFALWAHSAFGWGPQEVGYVFLYVGLILVAVQGGLIGWLSRRFGEARLVAAGAALITVGLFLLPFAAMRLPLLLLVNLCLAMGMAVLNPSINSLISQQAGSDERGGIMGVAQSASSLSRIIGPLIAGPLFEFLGRDAPYFAGAAVMAIVVVMALRVPHPRRPAVAPAESD